MLEDISEESNFLFNSEYKSFIKFSFVMKSLRNIFLFWKIEGNFPKSHIISTKIIPSHSAYQRAL